ncbi:MAG: M28 family peptidase, partial [Planctomycetes bacterium]|nr:M28 family peptidase [Planctomycetota bacterium]
NSTGCVCLLEMARILWAHRATLRRSVRLCFWPGHSHGRYSGSAHYADTFFTDLAEGCLAYHNIDSPGVRGATWYIARHTTSEVEQFCRTMIEAVTGQANAPAHRPARAADQSFLANGVPSFSTYPLLPEDHPDRRPWTGGSANAWWWHTEHDTLDKADAAILAKDTALSLTAVTALVNAEVLPLDYSRTAREIEAFVANLQTQVGEHFDFGPILADAARLTAATTEFEVVRDQVKADPSATRALNRLVIRLGRILNPVIYSQVGRFAHDPTEWSPIMRATKQYTLAALAKSTGLVQLGDTPDYGFLRAQIVREANRVRTALREAVALVAEATETGVIRQDASAP